MALLAGDAVRLGVRRPFERSLWVDQLEHLGVQSLTITNVTLLFTGMVLAVQTEQVDALRVLAASPVKKLVVPRVGALIVALPLLTVVADVVGLFGGMTMAVSEVGQTRAYFVSHVVLALKVQDVTSGLGKSVFFAFFIGIIACFNGLNATGGADGVGRATTNTVVTASIAIIVSDFFLTKIFLAA